MSTYSPFAQDSIDLNPRSPFFADHVSRYWWAADLAKSKRVLDCATGKGYGARILASAASEVLGIDLNEDSLAKCRELFGSIENLSFQKWDVLATSSLQRQFDVITAFEIIEHIPPSSTHEFLRGLAASLEPSGTLLLSTPNHDVVTKSGVHVPEFHINNFHPVALKGLLTNYFEQVTMLGQYRKRGILNECLFSLDLYNVRHVAARIASPVLARRGRLRKQGSDRESAHSVRSDSSEDEARHFQARPAFCAQYRFSPRHWRQAGLTVAVCRRPR